MNRWQSLTRIYVSAHVCAQGNLHNLPYYDLEKIKHVRYDEITLLGYYSIGVKFCKKLAC